MKRAFVHTTLLCSIFMLATGTIIRADDHFAISPEHKIQAGFLVNFLKYITWPSDAFPQADSPYIIGIVGEGSFGTFLDDAVSDLLVAGRRVEIRRFPEPRDIVFSHILFLDRGLAKQVALICKSITEVPTLTVSDGPGSMEHGVAINFFIDTDAVRFEINPDIAQRVGITISTRLLRLARIVRIGNPSPDQTP